MHFLTFLIRRARAEKATLLLHPIKDTKGNEEARLEKQGNVLEKRKEAAREKDIPCQTNQEEAFFLTSSLKKHTFYNLLINNILYLCVT